MDMLKKSTFGDILKNRKNGFLDITFLNML